MIFLWVCFSILIIYFFPKLVFKTVAAIVVIGLCTFGYFENKKIEKKNMFNAVETSIKYDPYKCSPEYPLLISIKNGTNKTVHKVTLNISVFKSGYSENIADKVYSYFETDKITEKGEVSVMCYNIPKLKKLPLSYYLSVYKIEKSEVSFSDGTSIHMSDIRTWW